MNLLLLQITSFIYIILLNIFYFSKEHISNTENRLYRYLLVSNVFGLLIEFCCFYTVANMDKIPILNAIITKLLLVYYILFILIYTYYVFVVSFNNEEDSSKNKKFFKKVRIGCTTSFVISSLIVSMLPMQYYNDGKYVYSYGKSVDFLSIFFMIVMGIWLLIIIKKYKNIKVKKYLPIIVFVVLAGIGGVVQNLYPYLLLTTPIETLVIFLMYFTIENPDMRALFEVHKAKKISDTANEEKTMFLYDMTNEIRNITKDIDSSADDILDETSKDNYSLDNINNSARSIKVSTAKFTTMTNEILDISSIDSHNIKVYNDKYSIKLILKQLVTVYKKECKKKNIDFRTVIATDMPEYLYGDAIGVKSSIATLLDNAVKYTEKGYIELKVNTIMRKDVCRLIISVEDSGIGMNYDVIDRLFNKNKDEIEKYNLKNNLYTVRKLITLMGGALIPNSTYGEGTTMKIVLDQKYIEEEGTLDKYENVYDKKRILLVDDNEASIKIINKLLGNTNAEIDSVKLGKEALDKIRNKEKYNLILLDEDMKPLSGIDVMNKFRDIRGFNTKVILLTKNNDYEYNEEYLKYGFIDYILKPIDKEKFFEKIDKYLK